VTVDEYLASMPDDRRAVIEAVRAAVNANVPHGYEEGIQYGMISWHVPDDPSLGIVSLANQKNHMALYLMGVYSDEADAEWFKERWRSTGKKLDMGKSCVRFKKLDDVPLDVVGEVAARTPPEELVARARVARDRPGRAPARRRPT